MTGALYVLVGPGDAEVARTHDLLASLWRHEPDFRWVVLVDDVPGRLADRSFGPPSTCEVRVLDNPRRGRGRARYGGLCVGALSALQLLQSFTDASFVLKMDPDSLVIGPFAEAVDKQLLDRPDVGALGTVVWTKGTQRLVSRRLAARRVIGRVRALGREPRKLVRTLRESAAATGPRRRMTRLVRRARAAGYRPGEHCQGGAYVVGRNAVDGLRELGYLDRPLDWIDAVLPDDVLIGVLVSLTGHIHADMSGPGQPFASSWRGLAAPPDELVARGHSLIHSLRDDPVWPEAEIRHFFDLHATDGLLQA